MINANLEREILRALDLAKEFKLKAIIAGGQEAWKVADRLKADNVPVLPSLDFRNVTAAVSAEADPNRFRFYGCVPKRRVRRFVCKMPA